MPFWTSALSEPRRQHRFLLTLPNLISEDGEYADGNKILYDALTRSGYLKPDVQEDVFFNAAQAPGTVNKAGALDALGNVIIEELSGQGGLVGTWTLNNAFIISATFGDLDYSAEDILNIDMEFRYDWADYAVGPAVAAAAGA